MQEERWWGMKTQGEYIRTLQRRVDFLKAREYRNSYDAAELGALEWALVNLPPQPAQRKPLTVDEVLQNDKLMSLNAVMMLPMEYFMRVVRAVEDAHSIKGDA